MKRVLAFILTFAVVMISASAFAFDFGSLGGLLDSLNETDGNSSSLGSGSSGLGDAVGGLSDLVGALAGLDSDEDKSAFPSLEGPFSGKMVKVTLNKKTYTLHQEFKDAMDAYEEFYDSYITLMTHTDSPDYLIKYTEFMTKYIEAEAELEKLDKLTDKEKDWSKDESAYFTVVMLNIDKKLIEALGTI